MYRLILLDRDGVLNVDKRYVHRWEDWEWQPKAPEAIKLLRTHGYKLCIVTNQSGIGRGLFTLEEFRKLMQNVRGDLRNRNGFGYDYFDVVSICTHLPEDNCECRKPKTALFTGEIVRAFGGIEYIDLAHSWMVGDSVTDVQFAKAIGVKSCYVHAGLGPLVEPADLTVSSLYDFAVGLARAHMQHRI